MKLAIIAVVAVLLLGGGAAGAYFFFAKPAEAAAGPVDEAAKAEHAAKTEEAKKEGGKEGEGAPVVQFVQMDPLTLPVLDGDGVSQTVNIVVSLEVPSTEAAAQAKRLSPRLQDAFIQELYGMLSRKNAMAQGVLQVAPLKERLNQISARVLGKDIVNEVLLQVVQQNQM